MKLNTSRRMVCFSDYPIPEPEGCDPFPTHPEYNRYLHSYVDHFGVRPLFRMGERVTKVEHSESGKWSVTTLKGPVEGEFDYVVVCVGNYVNPFSPEIPGSKSFKVSVGGSCVAALPPSCGRWLYPGLGMQGKVIHACEVKNNSFKGKNVLIQGSNISGTQLASIAAAVGERASISNSPIP